MEPFHPNYNFLVKETPWLHFLSGGVLLLMGAVFVADGVFPVVPVLMTFAGGIILSLRGFARHTIIKINRHGFYHYGKLITNWDHFIDALVTQKEIPGSIQDNFILIIRSSDGVKLYKDTIPLRNTQDKAEEEIIAAIRYFSKNHLAEQLSNSEK
jgi:hypothetical protein